MAKTQAKKEEKKGVKKEGNFLKAEEDIRLLIRSRYPILYLTSNESEEIIINTLQKMCSEGTGGKEFTKQLVMWDVHRGFYQITYDKKTDEYKIKDVSDAKDPIVALDYILSDREEAESEDVVYLLFEFHHYMPDPSVQRRFRVFAENTSLMSSTKKTIIILSPKNDGMPNTGRPIPTELENVIYLYEWPYPNEAEIRRFLEEEIISELNEQFECAAKPIPKMKFNEEEMSNLIRSCKGLTLAEIENVTAKSAIMEKSLLPSIIVSEKKQIIVKSRLCEYIEPKETLNDIGGVGNLKRWLKEREAVLTEDAIDFGCNLPNGMLMIGPWGSGKSSASKAVINEWKFPGLRINAASIFDQYVGSSERNCRDVLKLAESVAPCVTGDMRVLLEDGSEKTMEDIWSAADPLSEKEIDGLLTRNLSDVSVLSMTDKMKHVPVKARVITKRLSDDLYLVETPTSRIKVTGNHLWPVLDIEGNVNYIPTENLAEGTWAIVPSHVTPAENDSVLNRSHIPQRAEKNDDGKYFLPSNNPQKIYLEFPEYVNDDIMYLCGLMEADGNFGSKRGISLTNTNTGLHEKFMELMHENFGIEKVYFSLNRKPSETEHLFLGTNEQSEFQPVFAISIHSALLSEYFKSLSDNVLRMTPRLVSAWLSGYLDGDGSVNINSKYPKVYFASKTPASQKEKIRSALLRIGIVATGHSKDRIEVTSRRKVVSLLQQVFSHHHEKLDKIESIDQEFFDNPDFSFNDRSDMIYVPSLLKQAKKELDLNTSEISKFIGGNFSEYQSGVRSMPMSRFQEFSSFSKSERIGEISNGDFRFVQISSIDKLDGEEWVYDIVNENHEEISERNLTIENTMLHNCILWWDEVDNFFSGSGSSDFSDGGTTSRVIGIISTWMSEHEGLVFNIFTANDISGKPPKLFRKGRIDEIFIVDLPVEPEREEIFQIHLRKRLRVQGREELLDSIDTKKCAKNSINFSGSEIEESVNTALIRCFNENRREIKTEDIVEVCQEVIPLSTTMDKEIQRIREWLSGRAVPASEFEAEDIQKPGDFMNLHGGRKKRRLDIN